MPLGLTQVMLRIEGLRVAMQTRGVIEQAKGMLMVQQRCDAEEAFALLVKLSQRTHQRVYDVAASVVASLGHE